METVEHLEQTREELRGSARHQLGITGEIGADTPSLRETLKTHDLKWYPLIAMGLLAIVDTFFPYGFAVLVPDLSRALGISAGAIAGILALNTLGSAASPFVMAALSQRKPWRAFLVLLTGFVWSLFAIGAGFVTAAFGLIVVKLAHGLAKGSVQALHLPLLFDYYPPRSRVRILSAYQASDNFGNVLAPLVVAGLAALAGMTWRGIFVVMGLMSLAAVVASMGLRDPGFGRWDEKMIRQSVRTREKEESSGEGKEDLDPQAVSLRFFEVARRLMMIRTVRRLMAGYAVLGLLLIPYQTFFFFFLEERWNLGPAGRGLFFAGTAVVSIAFVGMFGRRAEIAFQRRPKTVVQFGGSLLGIAVIFIMMGALAPWFWLMVAMFSISSAVIALFRPAISPALLGVIPSYMRPHAAALSGIFLGGVGGLAGALFLSGIDSRYGLTVAMVSLMLPGILGGIVISSAGKFVVPDLDRMIDDIIEDEEIRTIVDSGQHLPMLACRSIDFSYGQLQVLFNVDFTVDDGEMVALLGTNGAGKSTLLRVISGIGLPTKGSVRYRGHDITYLDPERRVGLGIAQVPGGRAVFGALTVVENIRSFGYTLGRDRKALDQAMETCFDAFPRLHERRNSLAATLSGGEQQMLGLAKALILQPRLLLIDELSLGLAPVIVGQLLDMVRHINDEGIAVVLVEQSVNIALNLVEHAYFMEKGEIRFDGRAEDLLARDDLLRAVFLQGAAAGAGS